MNDEAMEDEPSDHPTHRLTNLYQQLLFQQIQASLQAWHYHRLMLLTNDSPTTTATATNTVTIVDATSNSNTSSSSSSSSCVNRNRRQVDLPSSFDMTHSTKCRERKPRQAYTTSQLNCLESEFKVCLLLYSSHYLTSHMMII